MRKMMILAALILTGSMANAQQITSEEQFMAEMTPLQARVSEAREKRDLPGMAETLQQMSVLTDRLSGEIRTKYAALPVELSYNQTVIYSMMGKTEEALAAFTRAIEKGFTNYNQASTDPSLASLRENPAFKALLEKIKP